MMNNTKENEIDK